MSSDDLVVSRPQGLYCPAGDFYIDPVRPVERAIITHGHADHARSGHGQVLASREGERVLRARLGQRVSLQTLGWGEATEHQGVRVSLHPAGHVLGSAQVRLQHAGQVWGISGDYFVDTRGERNPTCTPFDPVRCDVFISECTFGLPIYQWAPQADVLREIQAWWQANAADGVTSVLLAYSLGKAQRILAGMQPGVGPILVQPAIEAMNQAYRESGVALPHTQVWDGSSRPHDLGRALVFAPPGSALVEALRHQRPCRVAFASGWMRLRARRRQSLLDNGFVLSDHADWPGLQRAILASGAQRVLVTHGQETALLQWLLEQGLQAEAPGTTRVPHDREE